MKIEFERCKFAIENWIHNTLKHSPFSYIYIYNSINIKDVREFFYVEKTKDQTKEDRKMKSRKMKLNIILFHINITNITYFTSYLTTYVHHHNDMTVL